MYTEKLSVFGVSVKSKFDTYTLGAALVLTNRLSNEPRYWELWRNCGHLNFYQKGGENRCDCDKFNAS